MSANRLCITSLLIVIYIVYISLRLIVTNEFLIIDVTVVNVFILLVSLFPLAVVYILNFDFTVHYYQYNSPPY